METSLTNFRGVEAVSLDTASDEVVHEEISSQISDDDIKRFHREYGRGRYRTILPIIDQILRPVYIEHSAFKLFNKENAGNVPEDYPSVASISGVIGGLILEQLRSGKVLPELWLNYVEAFSQDGAQITPADYFRYYEPDSLPLDTKRTYFERVRAPLNGTVILNLIKIPTSEPNQ
jgi:hypothetical protein